MDLRHSPLDAAHRALGAKMVPFGGWDMPLNYGEGTIAEHREATNRQRDDSGRPQFPSTRQAAASIPYLTARFCQSRR